MTSTIAIQRVAVVGTGVIGASWTAYYLSRGFDVVATDPASDAETNLRASIKAAWKLLSASGLSSNASTDRLTFTQNLEVALSLAPVSRHQRFIKVLNSPYSLDLTSAAA